MIGDSTTRYLFLHLATALDGQTDFAYTAGQGEVTHVSRVHPGVSATFHSSRMAAATGDGGPSDGLLAVIREAISSGMDVVYFSFSEAWWEAKMSPSADALASSAAAAAGTTSRYQRPTDGSEGGKVGGDIGGGE